MNSPVRILLTMLLLIPPAIAGCKSSDERLAEFAREANERQARQNEFIAGQSQTVAQHSHELAKAARELVERDAAARHELVKAHAHSQQTLDVQRTQLDEQRQVLADERSEVAAAAIREPVIAQALVTVALLLGALVPLLVTVYALRQLPAEQAAEEQLALTLATKLSAPRPRRAPSEPPALPPSPPRIATSGAPTQLPHDTPPEDATS